ncbi:MAG: hypothetical protein NTX41_07045 [Verrucomicrobia bacterium]|nr:hypothetical protein [Verrucomicrobiota bacterium]
MKNLGRTYWFTWGFLILAAAFTGVASIKGAFFGGMVAALVSTLATRPYERLGARFAPLLGALLGVLWAIARLYYVQWSGDAEDYALARWNIGTAIAIHAAGFAGGALLAALAAAQPLGRSIFAGAALAAAMTAVPYGFIDWVDYRVAGPVEVVLFASAPVLANEAPQRRPGAEAPVLSPDEVMALKESLLVVEGPGGHEVLDDLGRRYWPLWRKRFTYPGNRGGPVRRVLVFIPPDEKSSEDGLPNAGVEKWNFVVGADPKGVCVVRLGGERGAVTTAPKLLKEITLTLEQQGTTAAAARASHAPYQFCTISVVRQSPFGQFYLPDPVKAGQPYAFDYDYTDVVRMAQAAEAKRNALQPAVMPVPAVPDFKSPIK